MTVSNDSTNDTFALPGATASTCLAPLTLRLLAAMVDAVICGILLVPMFILIIGGVGFLSSNVHMSAEVAAFRLTLSAWMVHPFVNGYLLATRGQTVGKWCFGLRIMRSDGRPASLRRLLLLRWLPTGLAPLVPAVGAWLLLIDPIFVFGRSRQCLHDLVADTIVVHARPDQGKEMGVGALA